MANNRISVELDIDPQGKGAAAIKGVKASLDDFEGGTRKAAQGGTNLLDVFKGNLLADYFQRATGAAVAFAAQSVRAAAEADDANRVLTFSATQAGIAYGDATAQAEEFGRRVGASNTEAARTYSQIIQLSERAGRAGDTDIIGKRFADLAAARGLRGAELSSLIGTILSGQDEGLNRLGIDDPGKLNEAYAASIGKTADALSQMEKARAALNAVEAKGAQAEGESAKRLEGTAGELDTASAAYANLTTQIGEGITQSVEFRDTLNLISEALGTLVTSHQEARRQLATGLMTPEQLAQEAREGEGRQSFNAFKGAVSVPFSIPFTLYEQAKLATGRQSLEEYNTAIEGITNAVANPGQRQYEADLERFRRLQREIEAQKTDADARQAESTRKAAADATLDPSRTRRTQLESEFETASKGENLVARFEKIRQIKAELRSLPDEVFSTGDEEKLIKKANEQLDQTREKIRDVAQSAREFLTGLVTQADKDNPFVALFNKLETSSERAQERFGAFGEEFAEQMAEIERQLIRGEIAVARFQSQLSSLKYEQEARRLRDPFIGLSGPDERELDVFKARFGAQTGNFADRREAENFRRGFVQQNPFQVQRENRQLFESLVRQRPVGSTTLDREEQRIIDDYILEQTKDLPVNARFSADPFMRSLAERRAGALDARAERRDFDLQDALERQRVGTRLQTDAREQLRLLQVSNLPDEAKLRQFLAISGTLSDKELTGDLRLGRARALEESARIESQREATGEARARKLEKFIDSFTSLLTAEGLKVDGPPSSVSVNVGDGLELEGLLGPSARPQEITSSIGSAPGFRD